VAKLLVRLLLFGGLGLLAAAAWLRDSPPPPSELRRELYDAPVQVQVHKAAFQTTVNGITYTVQPLYSYDLYGMVVSQHSADTWWDYLHRAWNDNLNITDLCVVWGDNLRSADLGAISFSSGQFQCFWEAKSEAAWKSFDQFQISNNHLLSDQPGIAKRLRETRIGDQVHFRGYLAEYSHNHGFAFKRGTSIVRTDTGNGACETVFVEEFQNLRPGGGPWRTLFWVALGVLALGIVGWLALPAHADN
jgi:hypothetical protein